MKFKRRGKYIIQGKECTRFKLIKISWRLKSLISEIDSLAKLKNKKGLIFLDLNDFSLERNCPAKNFQLLHPDYFIIFINDEIANIEWIIAHECIHLRENPKYTRHISWVPDIPISKHGLEFIENAIKDLIIDDIVYKLGFDINKVVDWSLNHMTILNRGYSGPLWCLIINLFMWVFEFDKIKDLPEVDKQKKEHYSKLLDTIKANYNSEYQIVKYLIEIVHKLEYKEPSGFRTCLQEVLNHPGIGKYFDFRDVIFKVT